MGSSRRTRFGAALGISLAVGAVALALSGIAAGRPTTYDRLAGDPAISPEYAVTDIDGAPQHDPTIAFDGTNYLVAWWGSGVRAARVDQFGNHLDGPGVPISTGSGPSVDFDGTNYLVAWMSAGAQGLPEIKAARVSPEDVVLDPNGIQITHSDMYQRQYLGGVAFDGMNHLVVWTDASDIIGQENVRGAHVSPQGGVVRHISIGSLGSSSPAVAAGDEKLIRRLERVQLRLGRLGYLRDARLREWGRARPERHPVLRWIRRLSEGRFRRDELPRRLAELFVRRHLRQAGRRGRHGPRCGPDPDLDCTADSTGR